MISVGVDIVEVVRIKKAIDRYGKLFLSHVYTPEEQDYCKMRTNDLAARYAAKEAVSKAIGRGLTYYPADGITHRDIEITNDSFGKPHLILHGLARTHAGAIGLTDWAISLSHTAQHAIAFVIASSASSNKIPVESIFPDINHIQSQSGVSF